MNFKKIADTSSKAQDSEIKPYILCLGNISKYFNISQ